MPASLARSTGRSCFTCPFWWDEFRRTPTDARGPDLLSERGPAERWGAARRASAAPGGGGGARGRARLAPRRGRRGAGHPRRHREEPVRPRPRPAGRAAGTPSGGGAMTEPHERAGLPPDLLADLDAGILDP